MRGETRPSVRDDVFARLSTLLYVNRTPHYTVEKISFTASYSINFNVMVGVACCLWVWLVLQGVACCWGVVS